MQKNILVAPLNWGLGHATRCIPIIKALEENDFTPILASDGDALAMLRKEFPHLNHWNCLHIKSNTPKTAQILNGKCSRVCPK
jgi:UDP:flavonoid glycosyltransferase YjiC (YdhE family)